MENGQVNGIVIPAMFGFSPNATGIENTRALQKALDIGGTIFVGEAGIYKMAGTVYVGSNTSLIFSKNVVLKKVDEQGEFCHVILNKGALTKVYDDNISIENLNIVVNGMDNRKFEVFGLHGQLAFFYVRDLRVKGFRCMDLGKAQYGIHICTFEDIIVDDAIIMGDKDGVHLGRGKRFLISNCVFETYDDAVALNAHDYDVGNPELGWIEDGVVEKCHDLNADESTGYFCRILAGAWCDWTSGMKVQKSDTVVSNGRLYRVKADADGVLYPSTTQPTHTKGIEVLDGISWAVVQEDVTYTAGVRNVTFRDIFLRKPRIAFSVHFDNDRYSRSYYPESQVPVQEQITFDNIRVLHDGDCDFLSCNTPVDTISILNSSIKNNSINFHGNDAMEDYYKTKINMSGCIFNKQGKYDLLINSVKGKKIELKITGSMQKYDDLSLNVVSGEGNIIVSSDLN